MASPKLTLQEANALVKNHKDSPINTDKDQHSVGFSAESLHAILAQPGCQGVNFIHAKTQVSTSSLHNTLVAVGYDATGNNITSLAAADGSTQTAVMDSGGSTCPPQCSITNDNSAFI